MNRMRKTFFYYDDEPEGGAPIEHAIDLAHENRITKLEDSQSVQDTELVRQLNDLRQELMQAIEARDPASQISALASRLETVEGKIEDVAANPIDEAEDEGPGLSFQAQEMEESPAPPEKKERKGIRARRKTRKKGGN
jgi:uncharacterized coiled-coil protein SlyX